MRWSPAPRIRCRAWLPVQTRLSECMCLPTRTARTSKQQDPQQVGRSIGWPRAAALCPPLDLGSHQWYARQGIGVASSANERKETTVGGDSLRKPRIEYV